MNVSLDVCLICRAIWVSFLHKHASVYLRFSDTELCWLSIQHNTMTNGHLLLRQIRLRESVFVSLLLFFYRTQLTMTSHTPCVLISFPSKLQTCTKLQCPLNEPSSHIGWQVSAHQYSAQCAASTLCEKMSPFLWPRTSPSKYSCCFISALLYSPCCNQAGIYMSGVSFSRA